MQEIEASLEQINGQDENYNLLLKKMKEELIVGFNISAAKSILATSRMCYTKRTTHLNIALHTDSCKTQ